MLFLRAFSNPHLFTILLLASIALILTRHKATASALPSPYDPDPNSGDETTNAYPSDEEIQAAFKGVDRDGTVVFADLDGRVRGPSKFAENLKKQWILDVFRDNPDGSIFISRNGRPKEDYQDFAERYSRVFLQASSGVVWLISRSPEGPRIMWDCSFWWAFEFVFLRDNPKVEAIILVDENDFTNHRILWPHEDDKPRESRQPDDPQTPDKRKKWPLNGGPLDRFGAGAMTGVSLLGVGGALPLVGGSPLLPGVGIFVPDGSQSQDTNTEQIPGVETDVLDHTVGDLPPAEVPTGEDQQQAMAGIDGTSDPWSIFRRRSLPLQSRDQYPAKICFDWNNNPSNPDFPSLPIDAQIEISSALPPSPPLEAGPTAPVKLDGGIGTVKVTQYQRVFPLLSEPDPYKLDVSVLDSKGQLIGIAFGNPPDNQALIAWCPVPLFAIYVWAGSLDTDPLHFKLGEWGNSWDSNDKSKEHLCTMSQWADGIRKAECNFKELS